jgi:hypothetical protein
MHCLPLPIWQKPPLIQKSKSSRHGKYPLFTECLAQFTTSFLPQYYLGARFLYDFEQAILHALNGRGQNQTRCILTGALVGAQGGLSGIPQRFLDGLENSAELTALACRLGERAERESV